jgi:hypothetical protein
MTDNTIEPPLEYACEVCHAYVTRKKSNLYRHITSCKGSKPEQSTCSACLKHFKTLSGLYKHEQKCTKQPAEITPQPTVVPDKSIHELIGCISNLTDKLSSIEEIVNVLKASTVVHNNVINGNVQNVENNMNINVFLNEHCKDAMNIFDFVKSIKLNPSHLDQFVSQGYVAAMSNIMVNELNNMPITQRPLHCTDVRRQTLHVKHDDKWHQETKSTPLLLKAITVLRHACTHLISQRYPPGKNRFDPDSVQEALYFKTHAEVSGGPRASDVVYNKRNQKIVTSVCKSVKISKQDIKLAALA